MQHRRHPHYTRRTAAFSFGLIAAGLACLVLGQAVRGTMLRDFATVLNVGFCLLFGGAVLRWLTTGETTPCPECGRNLKADPRDDATEPLTFTCPDCEITWEVDALENAEQSPD